MYYTILQQFKLLSFELKNFKKIQIIQDFDPGEGDKVSI